MDKAGQINHIKIYNNGKIIEPDISLSPKVALNPNGYCSVWTSVIIILFSTVLSSPVVMNNY